MKMYCDDYGAARLMVADGDVVILRAPWTHSPLAAATRVLLHTDYTHTATVIRVDAGVFVAEMIEGRLRFEPLSKYRNTKWDAFDCPVDRKLVRRVLINEARTGVNYDWGDLARIATNRLVGWPLPKQDDDRMICSAFSGHVMVAHCGWEPPGGLPVICAPSDLAAVMGAPKLRYEPLEAT